jgi:hypothetical protein
MIFKSLTHLYSPKLIIGTVQKNIFFAFALLFSFFEPTPEGTQTDDFCYLLAFIFFIIRDNASGDAFLIPPPTSVDTVYCVLLELLLPSLYCLYISGKNALSLLLLYPLLVELFKAGCYYDYIYYPGANFFIFAIID